MDKEVIDLLTLVFGRIGYPDKESQSTFEKRCVMDSWDVVKFGMDRVSVPCTCEDGGGPIHWASILADVRCIQEHLDHEDVLKDLRT